MQIQFPFISISNFSFVKETILPVLTEHQKKIIVVASLAFGLLTACYFMVRNLCFKANTQYNIKEKNPFENELEAEEDEKEAGKLGSKILAKINELQQGLKAQQNNNPSLPNAEQAKMLAQLNELQQNLEVQKKIATDADEEKAKMLVKINELQQELKVQNSNYVATTKAEHAKVNAYHAKLLDKMHELKQNLEAEKKIALDADNEKAKLLVKVNDLQKDLIFQKNIGTAAFIEFKIHNWIVMKEKMKISPIMYAWGYMWSLRAEKDSDSDGIDLYLFCHNCVTKPISIDYQLGIEKSDSNELAHSSGIFRAVFGKEQKWGLTKLTTLSELTKKGGYTPFDDTITFGCRFWPSNNVGGWPWKTP